MLSGERREARKFCRACPVRRDCLLKAILTKERWGVWGGLATNERTRAVQIASGDLWTLLGHFEAGTLESMVIKR